VFAACRSNGSVAVIESFSDHIARIERKLVVTITSGMASLADNRSGGSIAYRSSKAAVNMVMRSAAIDLAPRGIVDLSKRADSERISPGGGAPSAERRELRDSFCKDSLGPAALVLYGRKSLVVVNGRRFATSRAIGDHVNGCIFGYIRHNWSVANRRIR
jgi:hypothetical protein